jgi:hypothetical protein
MILKIIENGTNNTLEKLKEEYQAIFKVQSSFFYVAVIAAILIIMTIVSNDLWRLYSFLKWNKNKIVKNTEKKAIKDRGITRTNDELKIEKKNFENKTVKNRRNFVRSIDMRVLNFELERIPEYKEFI